ncbi:MAG: phosphoglucosamine mutase, partial [Desulfobacterales bacterium]
MKTLFGTDGIRGIANEYPMTSDMAVKVGSAVAYFFQKNTSHSKIIIGKDTRLSGDMIEKGLVKGIRAVGSDVYLSGILPTPGIAFLTASFGADAGIVISASHNPFYDNGIKLFQRDGFKLSDETETKLERLLLDKSLPLGGKTIQDAGSIKYVEDAEKRYIDFLLQTLPGDFSIKNMKIVIDCSHGATYRVAPQMFNCLGADVESLFVQPDGKNINHGCGSEHTEVLAEKVIEKRADVGLAFDGDGDRMVAVDELGNRLTGDQILAICSRLMIQKGSLKNNRVVTTVMSNIGLKIALKEMGVKHITTKVGDRYVLDKMISNGAVLGGEDSGHMIFLDHHTTGDGILTGLKLIEAMKEESKPLSVLNKRMNLFPQSLLNVSVKEKPELQKIPAIVNAIKSVETVLSGKGRVLV